MGRSSWSRYTKTRSSSPTETPSGTYLRHQYFACIDHRRDTIRMGRHCLRAMLSSIQSVYCNRLSLVLPFVISFLTLLYCAGFLLPSPTMRPSFKCMVRSVSVANVSSWVTMTKVCPNFIAQFEEEFMQFFPLFFESKLPDGSSARITAGLFISALATATRCFSPPESSLGLWVARSLRPINTNSSSARLRASFAFHSSNISGNHNILDCRKLW